MAFKFDKISEPLIKVAGVVSQVKILMAIKNAFIRVIPFTLVASFANIIVSVIGSVEKYLNIKNAILDEITKGFGYVNSATIGIIALLVVVFVAYEYSLALKTEEKNKALNPIISTAAGVASYFVIVPTAVDFATKSKTPGFSLDFFNYNGMFTGVIISMIGVGLFAMFSRGKFNIKMPSSVPQNIFESFFSLIPLMETTIIFAAVRLIIEAMNFASLNDMVTQLLVKPLIVVTNGLPAIIIVILIEQFLWFLGMHGFNIVWGVIASLWLSQHFANIAIFAKTQDPSTVKIIPYMFTNMYAMIGGSGSTFGLIIAALFICHKGTKEREVAKLGLIPGIFFINEPITFGLPIVLNPFLFIPWMLVPVINAVIAYFATSLGWVFPLVEMNPGSSVPIVFNYWVMADFHVSPAILCVLLIILDAVLYAPFMKMHMNNEERMAREQKTAEDAGVAAAD
ncbi:PTS sugar transporter subunit IIC [Lacticaseibacillus camelliae]|nr:PTS transporter subunit EIIC [Lacticaseibacillus camelliae]